MFPRLLRFASLPLLAVLVLFTGACSKSKSKEPPATLTQAEADDIVLMFTSMAATDSGGWLTAAQVTFDATPRSAPNLARIGHPYALSGDTLFQRGHMNWSLDYTYYDADSMPPLQTWDSTVVSLGCVVQGNGRIPLAGGAGAGNNYIHVSDLSASGLRDTITFGGFARVDSAFITINSTGGPRYYFLDNVIDYTYEMARTASSPFQFTGEATVDGFVDPLRSPVRTDRLARLDVVMVITFDGTQTPLATIAPNVPDPTVMYRYRVNLKTGAIVRAP